jgi:hypothetical protein
MNRHGRFRVLRPAGLTADHRSVEQDESLVYRTEVLAIIGALADLVVDVREIRRLLEDDGEEEADEEADR